MDFQHDLKTFNTSVHSDGSVHVSYAGSVVLVPKIDFNALMNCKSKVDMCVNTSKQALARANNLQSANEALKESAKKAVQNAKDDYLTSHRGGYDKEGCGQRADAEILAAAVHGTSVKELLKGRYTYDRYGHKRPFSRGKIFSATSVKKPEDYQRITNLYNAFPDVFNCSFEVVMQWYQKKYNKGGK